MAKKEFKYRGKALEELQTMSINQFAEYVPTRIRRSLLRGFTDKQKRLLERVQSRGKNIKTHCRDMPIIPEMVGQTISVHTGKDYFAVQITLEMLGHFLGEFALAKKSVKHSAPGVGATKSSGAISVK